MGIPWQQGRHPKSAAFAPNATLISGGAVDGDPVRVELRVLSNAECAAEGMSSAGSFLQRRSAVLALMAAAATLLPGLAVAQGLYLRAGIDLSRPADTHFTTRTVRA